MPVTGELIRAMNYVEDITATLRRICLYIPNMSTRSGSGWLSLCAPPDGAINAAIADLEKVGP
jgi:hypothetical protein